MAGSSSLEGKKIAAGRLQRRSGRTRCLLRCCSRISKQRISKANPRLVPMRTASAMSATIGSPKKKTSTPRLKTSSQILGRRRQQQLPWWVRLACVLLLAVFIGSPDPCACRYPSTIVFTTQFFRRSPFP
jgi:hypothetical protein